MPTVNNIQPTQDQVRLETISLLEQLQQANSTAQLPAVPAEVEVCRKKLVENRYQVLVMGEAKRGKSTFVNALIGCDLLPTDVDVATCQVFRVAKADQPAYRLRFLDGSSQDIAAEELVKVGSQVAQDELPETRIEQALKWIEVDVPARFLPDEIVLLDTPGLGALYASHAEITHRFLPEADAVIFVFDAASPISESELQIVAQVLEVTDQIFFLQTRIDAFRREAWQTTQQRSQQLLSERFGERLRDVRVWPLSSINLRKAAETGDEDYEIVSRHRELAPALRDFLQRNAGRQRANISLGLAACVQQEGRLTLANRLASLTAETKEQRTALRDRIQERRQQFDTEWGPRSRNRANLLTGIRRAKEVARSEFRSFLQSGGAVDEDFRSRIDKLANVAEANALAASMQQDILDLVTKEWRRITGLFGSQCMEMLQPLMSQPSIASEEARGTLTLVTTGGAPETGILQPQVDGDMFGKFRSGLSSLMITGVALNGGMLLAGVVLNPYVVVVGGLYAAYRAFRYGWESGWDAEMNKARQQLRQHLEAVLRSHRKFFFEPDAAEKRFGRADEYFDGVEDSLLKQVEQFVVERAEQANAEVKRLTEQAQLDERARTEAAQRLQLTLTTWDQLGTRIAKQQVALRSLDAVAARVA
ncbi:MAG: dynamin family protein [Planctomycetaceae bacterium]